MAKFINITISIVLLIFVFSIPVFNRWLLNVYDIIIKTQSFFEVMPAWFNFLVGTFIIALLIAFARMFRKK